MREQADTEGITSIAVPRIGVGYGGLSWKKVRAIVEAVFGDWPGTLVVYEEYVPGHPDEAVSPSPGGAGRKPPSRSGSAPHRDRAARPRPPQGGAADGGPGGDGG